MAARATEATVGWNDRASYEKIRLRPRNLVDVSRIDTKVTLFGHTLESPDFIGAAGLSASRPPRR